MLLFEFQTVSFYSQKHIHVMFCFMLANLNNFEYFCILKPFPYELTFGINS